MMNYKFSKEGKPFSELDEQMFLENIRSVSEKNGSDYVFVTVSETIPTQRRMLRFFFVIAEYIAIQNYYPKDPTRTDISAVATWLTDEFIPNREHKIIIGGQEKIVKSIKSKSKLSHHQMKLFIENVISWAEGQGYIVPNSEDYHVESGRVGQSVAHKNLIEELKNSLKSKS